MSEEIDAQRVDAQRVDAQVLEAQIGRRLRAPSTVVKRCRLGLPVVAKVPPVLDTGEPFPTRYWLSCPLAHRRIARVEAAGGVREAQRRVDTDSDFADALRAAHSAYAQDRRAAMPSDAKHEPRGGVGGAVGGVKCLHAHAAHFFAGHPNPVGEAVATQVGALNCETPCVVVSERAVRNTLWSEPSNA